MHVAVTAVGVDRPGIVAAVSQVLYEAGANVEDSRMALLGGHFSMMLIVAIPQGSDATTLEQALATPARDLELVVAVRPVTEVAAEHAEGTPYIVRVYGADRPGIVARVSGLLAARRVNITDLATHVLDGEQPVYVMMLEVVMPAGADIPAIETDLKALAEQLGVDVSAEPIDTDTL